MCCVLIACYHLTISIVLSPSCARFTYSYSVRPLASQPASQSVRVSVVYVCPASLNVCAVYCVRLHMRANEINIFVMKVVFLAHKCFYKYRQRNPISNTPIQWRDISSNTHVALFLSVYFHCAIGSLNESYTIRMHECSAHSDVYRNCFVHSKRGSGQTRREENCFISCKYVKPWIHTFVRWIFGEKKESNNRLSSLPGHIVTVWYLHGQADIVPKWIVVNIDGTGNALAARHSLTFAGEERERMKEGNTLLRQSQCGHT